MMAHANPGGVHAAWTPPMFQLYLSPIIDRQWRGDGHSARTERRRGKGRQRDRFMVSINANYCLQIFIELRLPTARHGDARNAGQWPRTAVIGTLWGADRSPAMQAAGQQEGDRPQKGTAGEVMMAGDRFRVPSHPSGLRGQQHRLIHDTRSDSASLHGREGVTDDYA